MRHLNLFLLLAANLSIFFSQKEGEVELYSSIELIAEGSAPLADVLTEQIFDEVMSGPGPDTVTVLDFHGETAANGMHLAFLGGGVKRFFREEDIPRNVYISSCRTPGGAENAPRFIWRGGVNIGSKGFIAPLGAVLVPQSKSLLDYRALRPYVVWPHLVPSLLYFLLVFINKRRKKSKGHC